MESIRSALWLVVDLVDDLIEGTMAPGLRTQLFLLRSHALDLLFDVRRLEAGLPPREPSR